MNKIEKVGNIYKILMNISSNFADSESVKKLNRNQLLSALTRAKEYIEMIIRSKNKI